MKLVAWIALLLGIASAVVGAGMVLSLFLLPLGVPTLAYSYVRLRWADVRIRRGQAPPRPLLVRNAVASALMLLVLAILAIALWPGEAVGYVAGGAWASLDLTLGFAAVFGARRQEPATAARESNP